MSCNNHNAVGMSHLVRFLVASLLTVAAVFSPAAYAVDTGDIVITSLRGEVHITVNGLERTLKPGGVLDTPSSIQTGRDGAIELKQGATGISVGPDTLLEFPAQEKRGGPIDRIVQPRGNAFYGIGKRTGGNKLRVETPYLVGVIKGTQFNVAAQEDSTTISLFEGRLEVHAADESDVVDLNAGEIATRKRGAKNITVLKMDGKAPTNAPRPASPGGANAGGGGPATPAPIAPTRNESDAGGKPLVAGNTGANVDVDADVAANTGLSLDIRANTANHNADVAVGVADTKASVGVGVNAGANGVGANTNVSVATPVGAVGAGVNAGLGTSGVNAGASLNVATPAASLGVGAGVNVGSNGVTANVGAAVAAPVVNVTTNTNLAVTPTAVDLGTSTGVAAGPVTANTGATAAVDTGSSGIAASVNTASSASLGATPLVGTSTSVATNLGTSPAATVSTAASTPVVATSTSVSTNIATTPAVAVNTATTVPVVQTGIAAAVNATPGTVDIGLNVAGTPVNAGADLGATSSTTTTTTSSTTTTTPAPTTPTVDLGTVLDGLLRRKK